MNVPNPNGVEAFRLLIDDAMVSLDQLGAFLAPHCKDHGATMDFIKALANGKPTTEYTVAIIAFLMGRLDMYKDKIDERSNT